MPTDEQPPETTPSASAPSSNPPASNTTTDNPLAAFTHERIQAYLDALPIEDQALKVVFEQLFCEHIEALPTCFLPPPITLCLQEVYLTPNFGESGKSARAELRELLQLPRDQVDPRLCSQVVTFLNVLDRRVQACVENYQRSHPLPASDESTSSPA